MLTALTMFGGLLLVWLTSFVGPLVHADIYLPHVAAIFVVYAALERDAFGALLVGLVVGLATGLLNGGARGLTLLGLLPVIPLSRWARSAFQIETVIARVGWVVPMVLVAEASVALFALVFAPSLRTGPTLLRVAPGTALLSALLAWPVYGLLSKLEPMLRERQQKSAIFR